MLGCLNAGDRVVWLDRIMVCPVLQQVTNLADVPSRREIGLARAQCEPDPRGGTVDADEPVEERAPTAADIEDAAAAHAEPVGEEVELATLGVGKGVIAVRGVPQGAGIH